MDEITTHNFMLYSSPTAVNVIYSTGVRSAKHVASKGQNIIFVGKPSGEQPLQRL
jgi:hypothetical protein